MPSSIIFAKTKHPRRQFVMSSSYVGNKYTNRFFLGIFNQSLTSKVTHMHSIRNNSIHTSSISFSPIPGTRVPSSGEFI